LAGAPAGKPAKTAPTAGDGAAIVNTGGTRAKTFRWSKVTAGAEAAETGIGSCWGSMRDRVRRWKEESWIATGMKVAGVLVVVGNAGLGIQEKRKAVFELLGLNQCHAFDPATERQYTFQQTRPCLSKKVTFIKWWYPFSEGPADIYDRYNRVFQVVTADSGQVEWREQRLERDENGHDIWKTDDKFLIAVEGGSTVSSAQVLGNPNNKNTGFVLRRIDMASANCGAIPVLEFFVENVTADNLHMRMSKAPCGQEIGSSFRTGGQFNAQYKSLAVMDD
jgi:hypothetical protein